MGVILWKLWEANSHWKYDQVPVLLSIITILLSCSRTAIAGCSRSSFLVIHVSSARVASNACCGTESSPCGSIEAGLKRVSQNGKIELGPGIHNLPTTGLDIGGLSLTISSKAGNVSVHCRDGPCFKAVCTPQPGKICSEVSLQLQDFTIRKGQSNSSGGCLLLTNQSIHLQTMNFVNCKSTESGGAIAAINSKLVMVDTSISSSLTIAEGGGGGISIQSSQASLDNVTLDSCFTTGQGGGILSLNSSLYIENSKLVRCVAGSAGGGLASIASEITLVNTALTACQALSGGGLYDEGSTMTITNSQINGCFASSVPSRPPGSNLGGGVSINGTESLYVFNSTVANCSSEQSGGGFYITDCKNATLDGLRLRKNSASQAGGGLCAINSALYITTTVVSGNSLTGKASSGAGMSVTDSSLVLKGLDVSNNVAAADGSGRTRGGGLYFTSTDPATRKPLHTSLSSFSYNQASMGGAAFLGGPSANIENVAFFGNVATDFGGAVATSSMTTFLGGSMRSNQAGTGGAIYVVAQPQQFLHIEALKFVSNSANAGDGGAIYVPSEDVRLEVYRSAFINNSAVVGSGGALTTSATSTVVEGTTFTDNTAANSGGAVSMLGFARGGRSRALGQFRDCHFTGNSAALGGGGFYLTNEAATSLHNSSLTGNRGSKGGAVLVDGLAFLLASNSTCHGNNASMGGGCLCLQSGASANLTKAIIEENFGGSEGGAIRISGGTVLTLQGSKIANNTADAGGAIWAELQSTLRSIQNAFRTNTATFEGGAIFQTHHATSFWKSSLFQGNRAAKGGAIIANANSTVTISGTLIDSNFGTAVVLQGNSMATISACSLINNSASAQGTGGAILVTDQAESHISASTVRNNKGLLGGGVSTSGQGQLMMMSTHVSFNSANQGGGIYAAESSHLKINASWFISNTVTGNGGGLAIVDSVSGWANLTGFRANEAGGYGGGIFVSRVPANQRVADSLLSFENLDFRDNHASAKQGAAFYEGSYNPKIHTRCKSCTQQTSGDSFSTCPTTFRLLWPGVTTSVSGGRSSLLGPAGEPIKGLQVVLLDAFGRRASNDNTSVAAIDSINDVTGLPSGSSREGLIVIPSIALRAVPGRSDVVVQIKVWSPTNSYPAMNQNFEMSFCPSGMHYSSYSYSCVPCSPGYWCEAGQAMAACPAGTFSLLVGAKNSATCSACTSRPGLVCAGGSARVLPGYWLDPLAANGTLAGIYACHPPHGCAGFEFGPQGAATPSCSPGYDGRLCSHCSKNHYKFLGNCNKCTSLYHGVSAFLLVLLLTATWTLLVWVAGASDLLETIVLEVQIVGVISMLAFDSLSKGSLPDKLVRVFNLALFSPDFLAPECWKGSFSYTARWYFTCLLPLAGIAAHIALYYFKPLRARLWQRIFPDAEVGVEDAEKATELRQMQFVRGVLNVLEVMYLPVALRVFEALHPLRLSQKVLAVDPETSWESSTHVAILIPALFYFVLYVVGLPLSLGVGLVQGRRQGLFYEPNYSSLFGRMYRRFESSYWWWSLPMEWGRRIEFAVLAVLWSSSPDVQVFVTLPLFLVTGLAHFFCRPFRATSMDVLYGVMLLGQYLFVIGQVGGNYFTSDAGGSPAEALAGFALTLCLIATCMAFILEFRGWWARRIVRQWAELNRITGLPADVDIEGLVPLEEISAWFNPRVMAAFFREASSGELELLQRIRISFSQMAPSREERRLVSEVMDRIPKSMRYSVVNQLIFQEDGLSNNLHEPSVLPPISPSGAKMTTPLRDEGLQHLRIDSENFDKAEGMRRLRDLRAVAGMGQSERRKAGNSIRIMLDPGNTHILAAWLLFGQSEGRGALRELVSVFRQWLHVAPDEKTLWAVLRGEWGAERGALLALQLARWRRLIAVQLLL